MKGFFKWDIEQNVCEKIAVKLDFAENSNFLRESTDAVVCRCSGINSQEETRGGVLRG